MYLRTTQRKNKDGSVVQYYQLAHNERHPVTKKPVAKIIHSFGRADELERDQLVRLCNSIARVCGLHVIDPFADAEDMDADDPFNWPRELKLVRTRGLGTVFAIEALWERLEIGKTLRDIIKQRKLKVPYDKALLAMTTNRLCEPESKLGVWDRWLEKVYLPSCDGLKLDHMYEAMDLLYDHAAEIEKNIFFHTANLFNLNVDLIFYDTTTAGFSIDYEDDDPNDDGLRKYGKSKEGQWAPQVVVALAVTREGFPVRCWVLPGNTADSTTIETVRKDLRGWNLSRALFVADAGINSEENRQELARACGKYLLATRMASVSEVKKEVLTKPGKYTTLHDNLKVKEVIVGKGERRRRYILCYNPKEAARQKEHRKHIVSLLEKELARHPDKSATAHWAIDLLASKRYKRYLTITKSKRIRIDRSKIRQAAKYDGKWVIETNDDSISVEDAANGYKGLMIIERCFRSLKRTQIKMTPMYHWLPRRIEAHVRICVLALLIERVAEVACDASWHRIRHQLDKLQATEFFSIKHRFFRRNEIAADTRAVFKNLKISIPKQILSIKNRA